MAYTLVDGIDRFRLEKGAQPCAPTFTDRWPKACLRQIEEGAAHVEGGTVRLHDLRQRRIAR
jgi:hypothetical protein